MRYSACQRFAFSGGSKAVAFRQTARIAAVAAALFVCAGLTACAEDPKYPSLAKITGLENILSPEERQKAVQDLQKQEENHSSDASKAIAKRDTQ
jgi:uncharacterized membrane protein YgcG